MKNIWLDIELSDYENHMALPSVAQSQYLSQYFFKLLESFHPKTVAILGCSGGNGLERINSEEVEKIICVDINPNFLKEAKHRYNKRFKDIEYVCQDITSENFKISNVDLMYAGLIFEYVDIELAINIAARFINSKGVLGAVLQQPNEKIPEVTPSRYKSLEKLSKVFGFVPSAKFIELCNIHGLKLISQIETQLESSKKFTELIFQKF